MTRREIIVEYLKQQGVRQIQPSRSYKYLQFETPKGTTYWVGKAGAVRRGRTVTGSVSLTGFFNIKKLAARIQGGMASG